ncbi:hypothetical protein KCP75_14030 [Salmonella enterica subsp. enterica]|nr:hypothetical protein KCP75_14030 [Salmonella enterica subsp. enterica]
MDSEGCYWARCLTAGAWHVSHRKESSWKSTGCRYVVDDGFAFGGADMKRCLQRKICLLLGSGGLSALRHIFTTAGSLAGMKKATLPARRFRIAAKHFH